MAAGNGDALWQTTATARDVRAIVACVELLQRVGLDEPNLFAVSAVDAHVRRLRVRRGAPLPPSTDPHVATGAIKAHIRAAESPLGSHLARTLGTIEASAGASRAGVFGRLMLLLGRITARVEVSRMNAHCLAKCIAPSLLHWDAVSTFSLLTLGKITAFVMAMVEEARLYDELLGVYCEEHPVLVQ
ncbi:hypothetical protein I4F81_005543 [Pyropia yezoensis]|uniref:Uncharacterized protein n=1 Tax=Pyropia yezoensis TaxID=2788 RepID=A0ACC3BZK0_PYRYE|nr:hypothetical protein I4F81_005543 [Neopyropia yezoensis]